MTTKSTELEQRVDTIHEIMVGPSGHPEQALVVTVREISKQIQVLKNFVWSVTLLGSGLIIKEIWALISHA